MARYVSGKPASPSDDEHRLSHRVVLASASDAHRVAQDDPAAPTGRTVGFRATGFGHFPRLAAHADWKSA